jgi:hypothetical protein
MSRCHLGAALPAHPSLLQYNPRMQTTPPPFSPPLQRGSDRGFCSHSFLSPATMSMLDGMRQQLLGELVSRGFVPSLEAASAHAQRSDLVRAVLVSACAGANARLWVAGGTRLAAGSFSHACGSMTEKTPPPHTHTTHTQPPPHCRPAASTRTSGACCRCRPTTAKRRRRCSLGATSASASTPPPSTPSAPCWARGWARDPACAALAATAQSAVQRMPSTPWGGGLCGTWSLGAQPARFFPPPRPVQAGGSGCGRGRARVCGPAVL